MTMQKNYQFNFIAYNFFFRFGKRYELPLLFQSIVMNATMLLMIKLCVQMRNRNVALKGKDRVFTGNFFFLFLAYKS